MRRGLFHWFRKLIIFGEVETFAVEYAAIVPLLYVLHCRAILGGSKSAISLFSLILLP